MKELFFFRIKIEGIKEMQDGSLQKTKNEHLVEACSYSEAESIATSIAEPFRNFGDVNIEVIKTKINQFIPSDVAQSDNYMISDHIVTYYQETDDTGVGLYAVKVAFTTVDERTGKEKKTHETLYVSAVSNADAADRVMDYLSETETLRTYVIRDIKFDKAEGILFTSDTYSNLMNSNA